MVSRAACSFRLQGESHRFVRRSWRCRSMSNDSSGVIPTPLTLPMFRRAASSAGGNGRTQPCAGCHGADLRSGPEFEGPPLAGRFASYLFRQLYGFQSGARAGDSAHPMQFVVAKWTQADMIALAAYAASLKP